MKFSEAYKQYERYIELKLKPQSIRTIKNRFKVNILPYLGDFDIYKFEEKDFLDWQFIVNSKNYSYKYKSTLHVAVVTFLNYCITYHSLVKNVASIVGNFKNNDFRKKEFSTYNIHEFKKFIKFVDNEVYKQFFTLMFYTGIRPGEAMALKFSDIDKKFLSINKTIDERHYNGIRTIGTPKTFCSNRLLALDNFTNLNLLRLRKAYIKIYNSAKHDYYIFGGLKPLSSTTINRHKLKACQKAGIKPIRLHDFRHSHATLLFDKNIPISVISKRLGHSNIKVTIDNYIHSKLNQEKRVTRTLNLLRLF